MGIFSFLAAPIVGEVFKGIGKAGAFLGERLLPPKKMTESEKADKYKELFGISEASTDSARQMFVTEMRTQKQPWLIRFLNGIVRPFGGLGALATEFYAIWGANLGAWLGFKFLPVTITTEQHIVLATIIAFYFGSRLREVIGGVATKR